VINASCAVRNPHNSLLDGAKSGTLQKSVEFFGRRLRGDDRARSVRERRFSFTPSALEWLSEKTIVAQPVVSARATTIPDRL
jgi:hypothetical protein